MAPMSRPPVLMPPAPVEEAYLPWGDRVREVVPVRLTAGAFATFQIHASATACRPAYVDHSADEAFVVLGGTVTITVSGYDPFADLGSGAAVYVPRGALRSFRTAPHGARLLLTQTPGQDTEAVRRLLARRAAGPAAGTSTQLAAALRGCGVELVPSRERSPHRMEEIL